MRAGRGQTVLDVAIETCGSAEAAWVIATGSGVSLTDTVGGVELTLAAEATEADVVAALAAAGSMPATEANTVSTPLAAIGEAVLGETNIIA